jgi:hypothetical protein
MTPKNGDVRLLGVSILSIRICLIISPNVRMTFKLFMLASIKHLMLKNI